MWDFKEQVELGNERSKAVNVIELEEVEGETGFKLEKDAEGSCRNKELKIGINKGNDRGDIKIKA